MKFEKINQQTKIFYILVAILLWLGLVFANVLIYIVAIMFTFAAITGSCMGQSIAKKIMDKVNNS